MVEKEVSTSVYGHVGLVLYYSVSVIVFSMEYGTCGLPVNIAKYGISSGAILLLVMGTAGFFTNIPAYGLDQLVEKSNTHSRAFIHWTVWGLFVGFLIGYIAFVEKNIYDAEFSSKAILLLQ